MRLLEDFPFILLSVLLGSFTVALSIVFIGTAIYIVKQLL